MSTSTHKNYWKKTTYVIMTALGSLRTLSYRGGEIILYEINCISKTMSNKEKLVTKMAQGHSPWPSFRETW